MAGEIAANPAQVLDPYGAAASVLVAAISAPNISGAGSRANTTSGFGDFEPSTKVSYKKPLIDFSDNAQVITLAALLMAAVYVYKRYS